MKRVVTAAVLAAFAVALCLFAQAMTFRETDRIIGTMSRIDGAIAAGDMAEALQISESFRDEWDAIHDRLCTILQHDHLDTMENTFPVLSRYIEAGEDVLASAECRRVITMAEHIERTERITPENIL